MDAQKQLQSEKNEDNDFDFFKKPRNVNLQKNEKAVSLEKPNINDGNLYNQPLLNLKTIVFSLGVIAMIMVCSVITINSKEHLNETKPIYIIPSTKVEKQIMAQTPNETKEPFNIDYSKLNKDDAERV